MAEITEDDLKAVFYMEPEEIVEFFKNKGLKTSFDWHEVYEDAHAKAFTVAKMTEIDLLQDTKDLLEKSIKNGQSYNSFKKEAMELFEKKGWVGFKEVVNDKTGEKQTVELGTPRRLKTIYTSNINSAYAAGRYKEQMEEIDIAPYWQYMTIADERTRPAHRAMHGKVFRADDDFWQTFYPPNGWGCRCFVRNLSKREVENAGLTVEKTDGKIKQVTEIVGEQERPNSVYTFSKDGNIYSLKPDAGWASNVGKSSWGIDVTAWNKVKDLDENMKYKFLSQMAANPHREKAYISWASKIMSDGFKNSELEKTLTWIKPELYGKIKNNFDLETPIIVMQNNQIGHSGENKNEKQALSKEEYLKVYEIINNPDEVYYDYTRPKWKQIAFIKLLPNDKCIKICVRLNQKSRLKDKDYLVSKITTIGKVNYESLQNKKDFKKIE